MGALSWLERRSKTLTHFTQIMSGFLNSAHADLRPSWHQLTRPCPQPYRAVSVPGGRTAFCQGWPWTIIGIQTNGSARGASAHEVEKIAVAMVDHGRTSTGAPGHVALSLAFFVVRLVRSCFARPMWC